ncbi:MAG: hypothetical protein K2O24_07070, partial [Muribaculaceae bacterium]|nr:hypothetical protein [Muribaculaceae bacterium]
MQTTLINGDLTVGRHVTAGGSVRVTDRLTVDGTLTVNGVLKARNIQGPCKGLFPSAEELAELFPDPAPGWWALVGKSLPALVFVASGGRWTSTGGAGGFEMPELTDCNIRLDSLDSKTDNIIERVEGIENVIPDDLTGRMSDISRHLEEIDTQVLERRPAGKPLCVHDPCADVSVSPVFTRSNFSGFAHLAGDIRGYVDTLEIPVMAADWNGNTAPLTSLLVVMRENDFEGRVIFSRLLTFSPVTPGKTARLNLMLGEAPLYLDGKVWIEFRFDAPCTLFINEGNPDPSLLSGRYYVGGRQSISDTGYLPEPPRPWSYISYRLLYAGGSALRLSDAVVRDIAERLETESSSDPAPLHETAALRVPRRIYAVEGDTLQLFYRGMICDTLVDIHRPMLQGPHGMALPRYWEYT